MRRRENICASIHLRFFIRQHRPPLFPGTTRAGVGLSGLSEALHDLSADGLGSSGVKNLPEVLHLQFPFSAVSLHPFLAHIGAESRFFGLSQCFRLLCGSARIKLLVETYLRFVQFAFSFSCTLFASVSCTISCRIEFFQIRPGFTSAFGSACTKFLLVEIWRRSCVGILFVS